MQIEALIERLDIEELAMAIEGPHKPVPDGSKYTLAELRVNRWLWLSDAEKAERMAQARSAIAMFRALADGGSDDHQ